MWPFKRRGEIPRHETRSAMSGFTAELMSARESYISGRRGIAELTATVQSCISLWEAGLGLADVDGTDLLTRQTMSIMARSLALRGEAVFLIKPYGLIPAADWDLRTRNGVPTAYRLSVSESGGGRSETALAGEVLHVRTGCDAVAPYAGTAPLKRAQLTAGLLNAVETALSDVYENAPIGSQIVPLPESAATDVNDLRNAMKARRGAVLVVEGVAQSVAAGMHPQADKRPDDLTPNLERAMTKESLDAARGGVSMAFGVLPALLSPATTGPLVREAQRHLAQWQLQPLAMAISEEATAKLGATIKIDVMRPLQAFDAGGRARAMVGIVQALAQAKEAGVDPSAAAQLVNWDSA